MGVFVLYHLGVGHVAASRCRVAISTSSMPLMSWSLRRAFTRMRAVSSAVMHGMDSSVALRRNLTESRCGSRPWGLVEMM